MARKTDRVTKTGKHTTLRDLRATKSAKVKGGAYVYDPGFLGGVQVASGDVNSDGTPRLKLAK